MADDKQQLYIGSADGKSYVVTNDVTRLPAGATPAPINALPTPAQLTLLGKVEIKLTSDKKKE